MPVCGSISAGYYASQNEYPTDARANGWATHPYTHGRPRQMTEQPHTLYRTLTVETLGLQPGMEPETARIMPARRPTKPAQ